MESAKKDGKPFFLWWNSTKMHIFTHLKEGLMVKPGLVFMQMVWWNTIGNW